MFAITSEDELFFDRAFVQGEVVLVLGAGASFTSKNKLGEAVKQGNSLAEYLAQEAGLAYAGEPLPVVLSAVKGGYLSESKLQAIYRTEYFGISPSDELTALCDFTWKRLYTWNIDDSVNNSLKQHAQRLHFFNGISDAVTELSDPSVLQVVKLHGDIVHPEHGFIMSEAEYAAVLARGGHAWYRKAAQDYASFTPLFIGSRLAEPILAAELERARRGPSELLGRGYVITPDNLSTIQLQALRSQGLIHIRATLADLVGWLKAKYKAGLSPKDVLVNTNSFASRDAIAEFTRSDIDILRSIFVRDMHKIKSRASSALAIDVNREARRFLRGFPPVWDVAASNIPVWLRPTDALYNALCKAIENSERMFAVIGQAGSGKTTALMQSLVRFGEAYDDIPIYEISGDIKSTRAALNLVLKLHENQKVVIYASDLFVFGDQLAEDLRSFPRGRLIFVGTARKGEWNEHLKRRFGEIADVLEFSRFTSADYAPLIERLLKYVPAPEFKRLFRARSGQETFKI